ncbi:hypothetical protein ACHAXR_005466 [Thalassiosira sp. AJA248-18]
MVSHRLHIFFLVNTSIGLSQSLAQFNVNALTPKTSARAAAAASSSPPYSSTTTAIFVRPRNQDSNWEDDSKSSRTNAEVTEYLPPWRDHQGQQAFSGSQAIPGGKSRPFNAFGNATPQPGLPAEQPISQLQQQAARVGQPGQPAPVAALPRGGSSPTSTLLHNIKWPLIRDPPGVSSEFPLLMTRIFVTMLATVATWYLHLFNGYSPVLTSSAMTLLVSTCLDRRLGQAAFCGSFAGMCGGHIVPNISMALALGALTSASYEVLIHINNFCLGIGGRLGATAFVATSLLAKYQGVSSVGRKMRRGLWKAGAGPSSIAVSMVLYHVLGSVATIFLRECSDDSAAADPVRASSVIGLLGSLFMTDPTAVLALYGGSFVGMALPSRLMYGNAPGKAKVGQPQTPMKLFTSFAGAGAISGLIHATTLHNGYWLGGWGGKAGLCAFAGCWVYRGFGNVFEFLSKKTK